MEENRHVDQTLDCKGLSCPMPMIQTKKAIEVMRGGEVLEVLARDPGSVADMKSWARRTQHEFLGTVTEGTVYRHFIRKGQKESAT